MSEQKSASTPHDIWVHPITLGQITSLLGAPSAVGVSIGNVGIYAGARLFTDCRQAIGVVRDRAVESGLHYCGDDPCGAAQNVDSTPT